jgi:ABC-type phosphate/phosphonate transport system substrate-binding protein
MKKLVTNICLICSIILLSGISYAEVKIGMLAQRGAETALKEWSGIAAFLSEQLGDNVTIVPLQFSEFMDFCDAERSAFIFTNPWFYVKAKVKKDAKALVTVKYQKSGTMMGGVIFTRRDSGITNLTDLKGKVLMCPKLSSPGGWLFAKGEIVKAGIVPESDLKLLLETPKESHDEVVYAIRDKKADVGTVRTNLLEAMQREGKINVDDFLVLNETRHEGLSERCSTPLYPDWPVASLGNTPPQLAAKMKAALLSMQPGHPALEQARKIAQFVDALDYGPMEELCRTLNVDPFRKSR